MYTRKFLEYNDLMNEILSEEDTLDNAMTNLDRVTKKDKLNLIDSETWAKYAFENKKEYFTTFYKNNKPIACVDNYFTSINISFLTYVQGKLFIHLSMFYKKYQSIDSNHLDKSIKHSNGNLFLRQINLFEENDIQKTTNEILFKKEGIMNIETITEIKKPEFKMNYEEKETKINIKNNYIRSPKEYDDLSYLLDYKNILKPEYLDFK